ncbi:MAG: (d)CMP kinase [Pseudomonadota bacterium]
MSILKVMSTDVVPVIAIDGPSASGKGTVAELTAQELGFRYLDSGAIYRVTAYASAQAGIALDDEERLAAMASGLDLRFADGRVFLEGKDVTLAVRSEEAGNDASKIAVLPALRKALLNRQRNFLQRPGLVADGRDMGSVVFPDAVLKIYLTASTEARAERRHKQLKQKGIHANLAATLEDLRLRDQRDSGRSAAPLKICEDAVVLDTTNLGVDDAVKLVVEKYRSINLARGSL